MMPKKSRIVIYLEFMQPQNPSELDNHIRSMINNKHFPPVREMLIGIDYKNLRQIDISDISSPLILKKDDIKD
jgi:hypothetical protein